MPLRERVYWSIYAGAWLVAIAFYPWTAPLVAVLIIVSVTYLWLRAAA